MAYDFGFNAAFDGVSYQRPSFLATLDDVFAYADGYCRGMEIRSRLGWL